MSDKPKILLVDDRVENLLALSGLLKQHDADLLEAHSGEQALELLLRNEVALAILDVQMPGMDGFQLAELMRGSERTRGIPIIFITAGVHDHMRSFQGFDRAYEMGAVDYLIKPIDAMVLRSKVGVFLQLHCQKLQLTERVLELRTALQERQKAEEALFRSNQRMLTLMEAVPVGISFSEDLSCQRITGNRTVLEQFAVRREDNLSPSAAEPEAPGRFIRYLRDGKVITDAELPLQRAVAENREIPSCEIEVVLPNGRRWIAEASGAPFHDAQGRVVGGIAVTVDITARKRAEEALQKSHARWELLSHTASRLLASRDPQSVVDKLCHDVMEHLDCQTFFNFMLDEASGRLHLNAYAGIPSKEARKIQWLDLGVSVCGCVARDQERMIVEDISHSSDPRTALIKSFGVQAYCCHPLFAQGQLLGTLSFGTSTRERFNTEDVELMHSIADQVATAMETMALKRALDADKTMP